MAGVYWQKKTNGIHDFNIETSEDVQPLEKVGLFCNIWIMRF